MIGNDRSPLSAPISRQNSRSADEKQSGNGNVEEKRFVVELHVFKISNDICHADR